MLKLLCFTVWSRPEHTSFCFAYTPTAYQAKPSSPEVLISTASFVWPSLPLLLSQSVLHIDQNSCLGHLPSSARAIHLLTQHSPSVTHNFLALTPNLKSPQQMNFYAVCSVKMFSYASDQDSSLASLLSLSSKCWYARWLYATHSRKSLNLLLSLHSELTPWQMGRANGKLGSQLIICCHFCKCLQVHDVHITSSGEYILMSPLMD